MSTGLDKFIFSNEKFLHTLPVKVRLRLEKAMIRKKLKKGRVLYRQNSIPRGVFMIRKGKVKIYQSNKDGRDQIMYIYTAGDWLGYRPLLGNDRHPVSAMTLEETSVSYIPSATFLEILSESPELSQQLLITLSREFSVWVNNITVFAQKQVRSRVALGLLLLHHKYSGPSGNDINLSRDDFASYVGTVKETLVRVLQDFKKRGWVESHGRKIWVLDPDALLKVADVND